MTANESPSEKRETETITYRTQSRNRLKDAIGLVLSVAISLIAAFWLFGGGSLLKSFRLSSKPNESDARKVIEERIQKQSSGRIRLVNVRKVDGVLHEFGAKIYVMTYEAEIEFLKDCYWGSFHFDGSWSGEFYASLHDPGLLQLSKAVKQGEHRKPRGELSWMKTENGWQLQ